MQHNNVFQQKLAFNVSVKGSPLPSHFHAVYGEYQITVDITIGVVSGEFPKRALRHVLEWYEPLE